MYLYLVGFKGVTLKVLVFLYHPYSALQDIKDQSFKTEKITGGIHILLEFEWYQNLAK